VPDDSRPSDSLVDETLTDFAVAAYREEGRWEVAALPPRAGRGLEALLAALRQLPAEDGALGLVSVGDDFCVIARARGSAARLLLSDVTAASEVPFAAEVVDALGMDVDDDDLDAVRPVGDLNLLADLGVDGLQLSNIVDDIDMYPDEMLGLVAERLGFGEQFDRAVEIATR
jgi:putative tRNA adenosine deaminase-associated protein